MMTSKKAVLRLILIGFFVHHSIAAFTQNDLNNIAANLVVQYDVLDNLEDDNTFICRIILTNTGSRNIERGPWEIYLNSIRMIEPSHLVDNPNGYILTKHGVKFAHIAGSLFKIQPVEGFKTILPGKSLEIIFRSEYWLVSRSDVMPNFYVASNALQAKNIYSTSNESLAFVGKFNTKEKWKRFKADLYDPFTPQKRFQENIARHKGQVGVSVIPTPVEMRVEENKSITIDDWVIVTSKLFQNEANYLGEKLKLNVKIGQMNIPDNKLIHFIERNITVMDKNISSTEAYVLNVSEKAITISASQPSGAFYGVQSLLSIVNQDKKQIPKVLITDYPRFVYRGMMVDIARNFHGKRAILKLMDAMAMYKMNKLHLHLSDDEGWRLEIPGLEELTRFGSERCHDTGICLAPQLGSGATTDTSGTGYLTVEEYKEILNHGKKLHIEVIPEFDMPGHSHASIKAMEYRYRKHNHSTNQTIRENASKFLLTELGDTSKYISVQMFRDNAVNPCLNSTYLFIEHILTTLIDIHKEILPLRVFHFGGDEVAKGAWVNSSSCQKLITQNPHIGSASGLKEYLFNELLKITDKYHVDLAAWEDGLTQGNKPFNITNLLSNNVLSYAWDNVWEWGAFNRAYQLANAGYKNVMCQATHLYFDMPYEPDPEERGYYWATRYTDTRKTFGFMPDNLYANAKEKRSGEPTSKETLCKVDDACPSLTKPSNIIGMQGHLWSETVRTTDQLFYMLFPRILAMAERAWHKASFENKENEKDREKMKNGEWEKFANILGEKELTRLDDMGIKYRVPLPGAKVVDGKLVARSEFPGLKIEYRTEDSKRWEEYEEEGKLEGKVRLRTKAANGKRSSSEIELDIPSGKSCGLSSKVFFTLLFVLCGIQTIF